MSTQIHYLDRDAAVALARGDVSNPVEPEETFADSIAALRERINSARSQLARDEAELIALTLGGPTVNRE